MLYSDKWLTGDQNTGRHEVLVPCGVGLIPGCCEGWRWVLYLPWVTWFKVWSITNSHSRKGQVVARICSTSVGVICLLGLSSEYFLTSLIVVITQPSTRDRTQKDWQCLPQRESCHHHHHVCFWESDIYLALHHFWGGWRCGCRWF